MDRISFIPFILLQSYRKSTIDVCLMRDDNNFPMLPQHSIHSIFLFFSTINSIDRNQKLYFFAALLYVMTRDPKKGKNALGARSNNTELWSRSPLISKFPFTAVIFDSVVVGSLTWMMKWIEWSINYARSPHSQKCLWDWWNVSEIIFNNRTRRQIIR